MKLNNILMRIEYCLSIFLLDLIAYLIQHGCHCTISNRSITRFSHFACRLDDNKNTRIQHMQQIASACRNFSHADTTQPITLAQ